MQVRNRSIKLSSLARLSLSGAFAATLLLATACSGSHKNAADAASATSSARGSASSSSAAKPASPSKSGAASKPASGAKTATASSSAPTAKSSASQPGSIYSTVPSRELPTASPVSLESTANFGNKVTAKIVSSKSINATAHGPGEISGPAAQLTISVSNGTTKPISLADVTVNLTDSKGNPANMVSDPSVKPFAGNLAAGKSVTGVYVFTLAKNHPNPVTISLSYTTDAPVVLFTGAVS
jgi:hypothetical protein